MDNITTESIKAAASGDVPAFEEIYRLSSCFVYNVAFRVVGNVEQSEEITQEVFLRVHRKLGSFQFQSSFKTWIYRVTVNTALNFVKKHSRHRKYELPMHDHFQPESQITGVNEKIEKEHKEKMIQKLLATLSPEHRACVVLRNIENLSYQEIAETLEININTVRSRLNRARQALLAVRKEVLNHE